MPFIHGTAAGKVDHSHFLNFRAEHYWVEPSICFIPICGQQVLDVCRKIGVRVPDEIAVSGQQNDELPCSLFDPPLSSVIPNPQRSPYEEIQSVRLRKAQELLVSTNLSVAEISEKVGYASGEYLSAAFKKKVGISPRAYASGGDKEGESSR